MVHISKAYIVIFVFWLWGIRKLHTSFKQDETPVPDQEETCPVNIDEFKGHAWLLSVNDEIYSSSDTMRLIAYLAFKYHFEVITRSDLPNNTFIAHFNLTALDEIIGEPGDSAFSVRCQKELFMREMERRFKLNRVIKQFGRDFNLSGYYKNVQGQFQIWSIKNSAKGAEVFLDTPTSSCDSTLKRHEELCSRQAPIDRTI